MSNPKISVIMSTFNDEKFIAESIESILNQTFKDFEFIVINDCSTDNTLNIIKSYQSKDNRIVLINNDSNLGLTKNLNEGLKIAKGKYIARMDADDIGLPERFQIQYNYLENHKDIFLVGGNANIIDEIGNKVGEYNQITGYRAIRNSIIKNNCIIHPSIMFRNEGFFYREKFIYSQDYDFYLFLLSNGKKLNNIPQKLIKYRRNLNSISIKKSIKQDMFAQKARSFFYERNKNGNDSYSNFNQLDILNIELSKEEENLFLSKKLFKTSLKNGDFKKLRELYLELLRFSKKNDKVKYFLFYHLRYIFRCIYLILKKIY